MYLLLEPQDFLLLFQLRLDLLLGWLIGLALGLDEAIERGLGIVEEARDQELLSLLFQAISEHVVDVGGGQVLVARDALVDVACNLLADEALIQNGDDGRSIRRLDLQHLTDEIPEVLAVHLVDRRIGAPEDLHSQPIDALSIEGMAKIAHLIEHAAEGPNVRFVTVRLVFEKLWRHVVRRPNAGVREVLGAIEDLGNAKVAQSYL